MNILEIIGCVIGWSSVLVLVLLYRYADDLADGNVERLEREKIK